MGYKFVISCLGVLSINTGLTTLPFVNQHNMYSVRISAPNTSGQDTTNLYTCIYTHALHKFMHFSILYMHAVGKAQTLNIHSYTQTLWKNQIDTEQCSVALRA